MLSHLDSGIEVNKHFYFITFLSDRFYSLNDHWSELFEKRFNKKFIPIYILPAIHNEYFREKNYIILNKKQERLQRILKRTKIISMIYPEELNKEFSANKDIKELIKKLVKKQGKVFIVPFTSVWLNISNPDVVIVGPNPKIAAKFDNKIKHIKVFQKLKLHINKTEIYSSYEKLRKINRFPFFLSASFSSGGFESRIIYTKDELESFYISLRNVNRKGSFIVAKLIKNITRAPNISAIILGKNQTIPICLSDQFIRGDNKYMGNIYPSRANDKQKKQMIHAAIKIGNYLSSFGFKGLFGVDFIITRKGECFPNDLNPRRQGGYLCNVLMSKKIDILDLELKIVLGEPLPNIAYEDFKINYCWAHSKLTPLFHDMKIKKVVLKGKPEDPYTKIGSTYASIYYPKNYILLEGNPGTYITSGTSYNRVKKKLQKDIDKIISSNFK